MTHALLRERLAAYAEGTLPEGDAEEVRAHLATGCDECLGRVFGRPVGVPRPQPRVPSAPAETGASPDAPPASERVAQSGSTPALWRWGAFGLVLLGVSAGFVASLVVAGRWARGDDDARAALASASDRWREERAALDERLRRLEAEAAAAEARARAEAARREERPEETGNEPEDAPPGAGALEATPAWLQGLLSEGGARVGALVPSSVAPDARGFAVWSVLRGIVVVVVSGLPDGVGTYRVRVLLENGSTVWVGQLNATPGGSLTVSVALPPAPRRRVLAVDVYRDPPGEAALSVWLRRR